MTKFCLFIFFIFTAHYSYSNECNKTNSFGFTLTDSPETNLYTKEMIKTHIAGMSIPIYVTANDYGTCNIAKGYAGVKNIQFCMEYIDPTTGTLPVIIQTNGTRYTLNATSKCAVIPLEFKGGHAPSTDNSLFIIYGDVGKINVQLKEMNGDGGVGRVGETGSLVLKPDHFDITGEGIPGTISEEGTPFEQNGKKIRAGQPFEVTLAAKNSQNEITPNFGKESTRESIVLRSTGVLMQIADGPCSGAACNGSQNNGAIKTEVKPIGNNGEFKGQFSFDEVGSINVIAQLASGNYMGVGGDVSNEYPVIMGRFVPDYFEVVPIQEPIFKPAHEGGDISFTYFDQPFYFQVKPSFKIIAKSKAGTITRNYFKNLWKFDLPAESQDYATDVSAHLFDATSPKKSKPDCVGLEPGIGMCTFSEGEGFKLKRNKSLPLKPTPPLKALFELKVQVIDSDGVQYKENPFRFGNVATQSGIRFLNDGNQFYHGRLLLSNFSGSNQDNLQVPMITQIFDGSNFVQNIYDNSTDIKSPNNIINKPVGIDSKISLPNASRFFQGKGFLQLSKPTPPNATGYVDLEIDLNQGKANLPWLQYSWTYESISEGKFNDNPRGRVVFQSPVNKNPP